MNRLVNTFLPAWFPADVEAPLANPRNAGTFELEMKACSHMDRRVACWARRDFAHIKTESKRPILAGDLVTFETPSRDLRPGALYLAVRLATGELTVLECRERVVAEHSCPAYDWTEMANESFDCASGELVDAADVASLGLLVAHRRPDTSPIPYGGAHEPVDARFAGMPNGSFAAVLQRDGSMTPAAPPASWVVYDETRKPVVGDLVVAMVTRHRKLPRPSFWQRARLAAWRAQEQVAIAEGYCVRRFEETVTGLPRLVPLMEGFDAWQGGEAKGIVTDVIVLGVVTGHKVFGHIGGGAVFC